MGRNVCTNLLLWMNVKSIRLLLYNVIVANSIRELKKEQDINNIFAIYFTSRYSIYIILKGRSSVEYVS